MNPVELPKDPASVHLETLRVERFRDIIQTIPPFKQLSSARREQLKEACERQAAVAVGQLGKKRLARVVWLWQARPASPAADPSVRVPRGRYKDNPTALL